MTSDGDRQSDIENFWREYLTNGDRFERRLRQFFRHIPHGPRCKLCAAPFSGPGAPVMRVIGKKPSDKNAHICGQCFDYIAKKHGGAEIEISMMFADIRGSTTLAEGMSPTDFRALLDRFYAVAARTVFDHDGGVDKFVGDEVVAFFFPGFVGPDHAASAIGAAIDLLKATSHDDPAGPWAPVGAGVATGLAWVGAVGDGLKTDVTAVGDLVNTTARLASAARAGEVLVTLEAARQAGLDPNLERRSLDLKGKAASTEVVTLTVSPVPTAASVA
jgi:adenylate cyclase